MHKYGITYNLGSDDLAYVQSGIDLVENHILSMWLPYPSAQILPGIPILFGLHYIIFGEGTVFWLAAKLLYFIFACFTVYYVYKAVTLYAPTWCGILSVLPFLRADFSWMNNTLLTETPFLLAFSASIYYAMKYGKEKMNKDFHLLLVSFMLGLLIRGNILSFPLFFFPYLLILKHDKKELCKKILLFVCVLFLFIIPWSIRNYIHFDTFIPLTYGSGNPTLLGTYQGINFPPENTIDSIYSDNYNPDYTLTEYATHKHLFSTPVYEEMDYYSNVDLVTTEKYKKYYDENGEIKPEYIIYVINESHGIQANYRMRTWAKTAPLSMIYSYLYVKPSYMINSSFYWGEYLGKSTDFMRQLPSAENYLVFILLVLLLIIKKEKKSAFFFPLFVYSGSVIIYCIGYSFERYNSSIVSAKYIAIGIGIGLIAESIHAFYYHLMRKKQN